MRGATKIFKIFGIDIKLHYSWWFVFIILAWSLSGAFFPQFFPGHTILIYWSMGVIAALLLFVSVLLHELSHSLVAKAKKIKVESITLFFFGGVAGITKEDMKPSSEFLMAIAGPLFSFILAGIFYLIYTFNSNYFWTAITFYLYQLNLILAIFNLIPGFPLDGGRALRAILYWRLKDLKKATKIAAAGGRAFAIFLIAVGILGLFSGTGGGLWFIFLGGFLYFIAGLSYEQVVLRETLMKISVKDMLIKKYLVLDPDMKFHQFLEKYANSGQEIFLVKNSVFSGILDLRGLGKMPQKMQRIVKLKDLSVPLSKVGTLSTKDHAYTAFKKFAELNINLLPVMQGSKFLGFITRQRVMQRLIWSLKFDYNGNESGNQLNFKNKQK